MKKTGAKLKKIKKKQYSSLFYLEIFQIIKFDNTLTNILILPQHVFSTNKGYELR